MMLAFVRSRLQSPLFPRKSVARYRQMTGEQRLAIALDLHEMSCDIAPEGIRRSHPEAAEVEQLLRRRLELARAE